MHATINLSFDVSVSEWNGQGIYLAEMTTPLKLNAAGATPEEALANLKELLLQQLSPTPPSAIQIVSTKNPWADLAKSFQGTPFLDEWHDEMHKAREQEVLSTRDRP